MNALYRRCLPPRAAVLGFAAWSLVEASPTVGSGYLLGHAVDATVRGHALRASGYLALLLVLVAVGMAGTRAAFPYLARITDSVRDRLTEQVVGGALRTLAATGRPTGVPVAQLGDQIDQVRSLLATVLRGVRSTLLPMVGVIAGLCALDVHLAVVALVPLVLALSGYAISLRRLRERLTGANESEERLGDQLTSVVSAVPVLRDLGAQDWARARLAGGVTGVATASLAAARMQALRHAVIGCGALVPLIGVLAYAQTSGRLTGGALLGAVTYLLAVLAPALSALVGGTGGWVVQLQVLMRRLERVARVGEASPPVPHRRALPGRVLVQADHVGFAYPGAAREVLDDVTVQVSAGELLAAVGPSGGGKSTLARMITGLLEPTSGSVAVDTQARLGYVPQHPYLFSGTLRENLAFDAAEPDERLVECARLVGLDDLLERIGLDGELVPAELERHERRQLVLARALAPRPDLLVLDETLAGLDDAQARRLEGVLRHTGAAIVLISHDPSLAERADHVVDVDAGPRVSTPPAAQRSVVPAR